MSKGFFIVIKKSARNRADERWIASYIEPLAGWDASQGKDLEEITQLQKNQYHTKKTANEPIPELVHNCEGPMASGKITRFVEVENNNK